MKQEWSSFEMKEAPMTEVDSSIAKTCEQSQTKLNEEDGEGEMVSISKTLATLPSYLGHQEFNSEIVPLPVTNGDSEKKEGRGGLELASTHIQEEPNLLLY